MIKHQLCLIIKWAWMSGSFPWPLLKWRTGIIRGFLLICLLLMWWNQEGPLSNPSCSLHNIHPIPNNNSDISLCRIVIYLCDDIVKVEKLQTKIHQLNKVITVITYFGKELGTHWLFYNTHFLGLNDPVCYSYLNNSHSHLYLSHYPHLY